ncbi:MAG: TraB/GumN family protein [Nanoarchaeota archaeon]|nr:TraB/GumN family protein [Nanoarchaeota archaeon]MBU1445469.1 TraB/GumN family protein [Nanoarchaeota archaeon]MBU2406474.1 TraB/GumN family protein [Nanoarchaeota archaeon]MBU2420657.1 TraB/GumN family protein [Nanoarchaeota archaeon]MBU2475394.1 TraB/GumN family protein [Nanoarchaeota archaeon]
MIKYKNLSILGTSHIAAQSIQEVKDNVEEIKPNIIALELDYRRFRALTSKKPRGVANPFQFGMIGFIFNQLGAYAEKKLGKLVGITPGSEMVTAAKLAKKHKIKIVLIDQDISITLKNLSKEITRKEKWRFIADLFKAGFTKENRITIDLTKVPEEDFIKKIIKQVKDRYPSFYKVIVKDRDKVMAKNLYTLISNNKDEKILAIVGAGHEKDMLKEIKRYEKSDSVKSS